MGQDRDVSMGLSVKAMIFFEAKLLLLRKNDGKTVFHWEFPGGGLRRGENFLDGLYREVKEETGLSVHVDGLAGTWQYRKRNGQFLNGVIYTATATRQEVMISSEHTDYAWVRPDELNQYPIHASLHTALRQMEKIPAFSTELLKEFLTAPREAARE